MIYSRHLARISAVLFFSHAAGALAEELRRIDLRDHGLASIRSAIWSAVESKIIVTDPGSGRVLELSVPDTQGKVTSTRSVSGLIPDPESIVSNASYGFIQVGLDPNYATAKTLNWFAPDLKRLGSVEVRGEGDLPLKSARFGEVLSLFNWVVAGDYLFAYGVVSDPNSNITNPIFGPFSHGFFKVRLISPKAERNLPRAEVVVSFQDWHYYVLGYPYVAAIGEDVYYLEMGAYPSLYYYDITANNQPSYLRGYRSAQEALPSIDSTRPTHQLFKLLESLQMPAGIYTQDGYLYILSRQAEDDSSSWNLNKLKPIPVENRVEDLGSVKLPTKAKQLTVLPTPASWFVFEKSSVRQNRTQDVPSMLVIPTSWIQKHTLKPKLPAGT